MLKYNARVGNIVINNFMEHCWPMIVTLCLLRLLLSIIETWQAFVYQCVFIFSINHKSWLDTILSFDHHRPKITQTNSEGNCERTYFSTSSLGVVHGCVLGQEPLFLSSKWLHQPPGESPRKPAKWPHQLHY
jgi:hypothetical protein